MYILQEIRSNGAKRRKKSEDGQKRAKEGKNGQKKAQAAEDHHRAKEVARWGRATWHGRAPPPSPAHPIFYLSVIRRFCLGGRSGFSLGDS